MFRSMLVSLYRHWRVRSLSAKLLLPIVGLMLISLLGSALTFIFGTMLTQNQFLEQQFSAETEQLVSALNTRVSDVATAADLLANDPNVLAAIPSDSEAALKVLNDRSVQVRNRFNVDLIQLYDQEEQGRTNLMLSALSHESLVLEYVRNETAPIVRVVDDRLLLLTKTTMARNLGIVIVGIDLESELHRLASRHRLPSDVGLVFKDTHIGTRPDLPFTAPDGRGEGYYSQRHLLVLGYSPVELLLVRPTTEMTHVATTGLIVMTGSALLTTVLLIGLSVAVTRSIVGPIQQLSEVARCVAKGDMSPRLDVGGLVSPIGIGHEDEVHLLATTFNSMVTELSDLYENLESKVKARTWELATTAKMANAVSSSLEVGVVLQRSVQLIQERLEFYQVGVFLVEPGADVLVLHDISCAGGQLLKVRDFQIPLGSKSPVGVAAATQRPQVIQDVMAERTYLETPLLLDVNAEAAIPMLIGDTVIGVLDVQSRERHVFSSELVDLLGVLADQIAIGVHNAQLYAQQRRMTEHLTQVDQLKTQFLAVMSHELRTPLNSIIGFSKVLLKGLDGPLNETQSNDINIIHESGQHLLSLIEEVLDISSINAGHIDLEYEEIDLRALVKSMFNSVAVLVGNKPVSLEEHIDPTLPPVFADRRRLRQILLNLLSNAVKFTDYGKISVYGRLTRALNPHTQQVEPYVEISVSDTGIGIPEDKIGDIFKEFTQVDSSGSRRYEGIGLGLPITRRLVELHGGRIWVKTKVGQGSTFAFILPLHRIEPEEAVGFKEIEMQGEEQLCSAQP